MIDKTVQLIVKVNGKNLFYLYDKQIKDLIADRFLKTLTALGQDIKTVECELNVPPKKSDI